VAQEEVKVGAAPELAVTNDSETEWLREWRSKRKK